MRGGRAIVPKNQLIENKGVLADEDLIVHKLFSKAHIITCDTSSEFMCIVNFVDSCLLCL